LNKTHNTLKGDRHFFYAYILFKLTVHESEEESMSKKIFRPRTGGTLFRLAGTLFLFAGALFVCSCESPQGTHNGEGSLTVMLPAGNQNGGMARSVLSDSFTPTLRYVITLTGPGGTIEREAAGGSVTVALSPGVWTITVNAYTSAGVLAGTGSETAIVAARQPVSVGVKMTVDPAYAAGLSVYYIHSEADLRQYLDNYDDMGTTAFLERDITVAGSPAGVLYGTLDGQGHTITLTINAAASNAGLLESNAGTVKNLRLEGTLTAHDVYGYVNAGAVAGTNSGSIKYVFSDVTVTAHNAEASTGGLYAGGIAGQNYGTIEVSSAGGNTSGDKPAGAAPQTGGIAGKNNSGGIITYCYAWGNVTNNGTGPAGGIAGRNEGTITWCAALNSNVDNGSTSTTFQGRVIGSEGGSPNYNYAYENTQVGGVPPVTIYSADRVAGGKQGADISALDLGSSAKSTLWNNASKVNWPSFLDSPSAREPPSGVSRWWWSKTITIDGNAVNGTGVPAARVPALWFEEGSGPPPM
jgi:hypothetical protein